MARWHSIAYHLRPEWGTGAGRLEVDRGFGYFETGESSPRPTAFHRSMGMMHTCLIRPLEFGPCFYFY